jgi:hypothetical protein
MAGSPSEQLLFFLTHQSIHHLADIWEASTAFGILIRTLTSPKFFCFHNFYHYSRVAVLFKIIGDIGLFVLEAVAYKVVHFYPQQCCRLSPLIFLTYV